MDGVKADSIRCVWEVCGGGILHQKASALGDVVPTGPEEMMKTGYRNIALAVALSMSAAAIPAMAAAVPAGAAAQDRDHHEDHPEYLHNKYYKTGNREGYHDYRAKQQRPETEHRHHYRNDTDRQAHDYGYQHGYQGQRYDHPR